MPAPHHSTDSSFFTGRMPFLPPNQQRQSTEGLLLVALVAIIAIIKMCAQLNTALLHFAVD